MAQVNMPTITSASRICRSVMWTAVRTNGLYRYLSVKPITHAAHCFKEGIVCIGIELLAKILHVYIKNVREAREVEAPHVVHDGLARQGLVRVPHEALE